MILVLLNTLEVIDDAVMSKLKFIVGNNCSKVYIEYIKSMFMIKTHSNDSVRGLKYRFELTMSTVNDLRLALKSLTAFDSNVSFVEIPEYSLVIQLKTSDVFVTSGSMYSNIRDKVVKDPVLYMELIVIDE